MTWKPATGADFYVVRYDIAADRLFNSYQIAGATALEIRSLNAGMKYFFSVDAVNAAGIVRGSDVVALEP